MEEGYFAFKAVARRGDSGFARESPFEFRDSKGALP